MRNVSFKTQSNRHLQDIKSLQEARKGHFHSLVDDVDEKMEVYQLQFICHIGRVS